MKRNLLLVVMMLGVSLFSWAGQPLTSADQINSALGASEGWELYYIEVYYNGNSYGHVDYVNGEANCVITPEVYGKELEIRAHGKNSVGTVGEVLRVDGSALVNRVEVNSTPFDFFTFYVGVPPRESQSLYFWASASIFLANGSILASAHVNFRIDTISFPTGGSK